MAGVGFTRRYLSDPGMEELLAIEGVVIIDNEQPGQVVGAGSGAVNVVGEFEDGPFNESTEVTSPTDYVSLFGRFGYVYLGVVANHPCARSRYSDGALTAEHWNGNGYIATANKKYRRLFITRVDTSVGAVTFTRFASIVGNSLATWAITAGDSLSLSINGAGAVVSTLAATRAVYNSGAGAYPTGFAGGEHFTLTIDLGRPTQIGPTVITFLLGDQTQADIIARINLAMGYVCASNPGAGVTRFTGRVYGTGGNVTITASDAPTQAKIGIADSATPGTGDVVDCNTVTLTEFKTNFEADVAGSYVDRDYDGNLRITSTSIVGTNSIQATAGTLRTVLGLPSTAATRAATAVESIPAGTEVNDGVTTWVTMVTQAVPIGGYGPYTIKVRPATDDGTALGCLAAAAHHITSVLPSGSWQVSNSLPIAVALSEAAIDSAYATAMDATKNVNTVARQTNVIVSARQSNLCRSWIKQNVIDASASGCYGRTAPISPPLGTTTRAMARGTGTPGVGATREERLDYCYPGAQTFIKDIATIGVAGGAGFTADGYIDTHFDAWVASLLSQLNPEENPGQETTFLAGITGIESGNADVQTMDETDYRAFKAAGIAALRISDGVAFIQSGKTSVDPAVNSGKQNVARRRMADYIEDSLAQLLLPYSKKLAKKTRRALVLSTIQTFLDGLTGKDDENLQRIHSYLPLDTKANTLTTLATGLFRVKTKVRTLSSLDVIVLDCEVGENVVTVEAA
jgi:hypothetical protein